MKADIGKKGVLVMKIKTGIKCGPGGGIGLDPSGK
jgi:hypothetical protein